MAAAANAKNALERARNTYKLCGAKKARVKLLHMVPMPDEVPLMDAEKYSTEDFDVVVIGCQLDRKLFQVTRREPIPEIVARRCNKPLVMVRAAVGIRSWIKRWI